MTKTAPTTVDRIVSELLPVATDETAPEIRRRTQNLLTEEGFSPAEVRTVLETQLATDEVASIESIKTARMDPLETTIVGILHGIADYPQAGAIVAYLVDGTGRIRVVLSADAIGKDSIGTAVRVRHAGVRRTVTEPYAFARSRTSIEEISG